MEAVAELELWDLGECRLSYRQGAGRGVGLESLGYGTEQMGLRLRARVRVCGGHHSPLSALCHPSAPPPPMRCVGGPLLQTLGLGPEQLWIQGDHKAMRGCRTVLEGLDGGLTGGAARAALLLLLNCGANVQGACGGEAEVGR